MFGLLLQVYLAIFYLMNTIIPWNSLRLFLSFSQNTKQLKTFIYFDNKEICKEHRDTFWKEWKLLMHLSVLCENERIL